jgi:hypothetical protein
MENNALENAAQSLMDDDSAQTVDTSTETQTSETSNTNAPADNASNPSQVNETPQDKQNRSGRYEKLQKSYDEYRAHNDRKTNEYVNKIQSLEKRLSSYAPLDPLLPELQKILAERKQADLQQQFQTNPIQVQQQLMEQMLAERLAPLQQQAAMAEINNTVNENVNYLKTTYGEQAFNEAAPIMQGIIENVKNQYGNEISDILVRNPDHLMMTALGHMTMNAIKQFNANKAQGSQNKQQMAKVAAGVSKPNRGAKAPMAGSSREDIEKAAFAFLEGKS